MRIKALPGDFKVEERIDLPAGPGPYAYYRVEKTGRTTLAVQEEMARALKVTPSALAFPALKDKAAVAVQYASVRKRGPKTLEGKGWRAEQTDWGTRALRTGDLQGNHFTVIARNLSPDEAAALMPVADKLGRHGLINYFDDQRFGSYTQRGFIGKEILKRDAEQVVWMYLSEEMIGDPREVKTFKRLCASHWGQWGYLLHQAPRPSNYRSVITYLKDHPHEYRKAANLIKDRLLSIYLSAYQSWIWNLIIGAYLERDGEMAAKLDILHARLPAPEPGPELAPLRETLVDLPRLTARYPGDFRPAADKVFADEDLELRDFKARILRRVYLTKGERPVAFLPIEVTAGEAGVDEEFAGRRRATIAFALGPGQYATLVLKAAAALIGTQIKVR